MSFRHDGLQEICYVAHACCVVLCGLVPTSGPKRKQNTGGKIGKTKRALVSDDGHSKEIFEAINLIQSLQQEGGQERKYCFERKKRRIT